MQPYLWKIRSIIGIVAECRPRKAIRVIQFSFSILRSLENARDSRSGLLYARNSSYDRYSAGVVMLRFGCPERLWCSTDKFLEVIDPEPKQFKKKVSASDNYLVNAAPNSGV